MKKSIFLLFALPLLGLLGGPRTAHQNKAASADSTITITVVLGDKWNMVSIPVAVADSGVTSNFPAPYAFGYTNTDTFKGYSMTNVLRGGIGYWIKVEGTYSAEFTGGQILEDTVSIHAGWNIIGSISAPVPFSKIKVLPSGTIRVIPMNVHGPYQSDSVIHPGQAFWANVHLDSAAYGRIVLSAR